jgi:hypothetical protein
VAAVAEKAELFPALIDDGAKGVGWGTVVGVSRGVDVKCRLSWLSTANENRQAPE